MNMERFDHILAKGTLTGGDLRLFFEHYADIEFVPIEKGDDLQAFYCKGMLDSRQLNEYFNRILLSISREEPRSYSEILPPVQHIKSMKEMIKLVFSGSLIVFREGTPFFYVFDISKVPQRNPQESSTEVSIKGPKDSFTEEMNTNISLIRKRVKSEQLYCESFTLGSISKTEVSLLYLHDKVNSDFIKEARHRLNDFQGESIVSSGQLEQWLSDRSFSLFPLFDYVTRPDFVVESMLRGRFILIVNGSPSVLIGPTNVFELIKSPEDVHFPYYFVVFGRLIRMIGLIAAIFLPGFWVSLASVNNDQLPFALLATLVVSREGLPLPTGVEAIFILGLFELLREAGVRMPTVLGQTVSIVGGIIIGDAAIRAGLTSPTMIVIIALTAVASYTLVNQSLVGTVSILRFFTLLLSIFLGVYGLFIGALSILIYLSVLESFKVAYLEPIASLKFREYLAAFFVNPFDRKRFGISFIQKRRK
ncbi:MULTISPECIES: spore germination protein [Bacillaceae]|uniref:Spore germination protein n=1 Tax=Bacillus infantis TaxID=324767 RepID=A0A5D4SLB1_9BACI|nr:spore germination protein [Bacillus infantis]MDW2876122.1 spore germination protein [Bacillus infantis]TYS64227.1 spore germination protein [Bacillus infantis]